MSERPVNTGDDVAARLAADLHRRGVAAPVRLLLDAHAPLSPLLTDLGVALAALARLGGAVGRDAADLLADERAMDRMIDALDAAGDRRAEPR